MPPPMPAPILLPISWLRLSAECRSLTALNKLAPTSATIPAPANPVPILPAVVRFEKPFAE